VENVSNCDAESLRPEETIEGAALTVDDLRLVARRQLVGSIVVALLITAIAGLAALKPTHKEVASAPTHAFPIVRQPTFATGHGVAATELP
jgi:hypothetical protein